MKAPRMRLFPPAVKGSALSLALLASVAPAALWAEPITAIKITGNERVENETIQSYLPFHVGEEYDPAQTSRTIRSLFATGMFANVKIGHESGQVVVDVVENPMVNRVVFEGNDAIDSKRLEELVGLKPRSIYSPAKVQSDIQALQAAYRSRGRFTTTINAQLIEREQNRVDVIYKITEGAKTRIEKINFVGNKKFDDSELSQVIATKESAWWRFLSSTDNYDPARIEVDRDMLRRFYLSRGYADVQITSAVAELTRDKKDFVLTYTVYEGPRYDFGITDVTLTAEAEGLNVNELKPLVTLKSGELFDAQCVDNTTDKLIDALGTKGYAFLDVKPEYQKDEAARTIGVTFNVRPGPRVYVDRINIEGNTRTRDYVIRREMRLAENDAYSSDKVKRSKDRLTYLGYFQDVNVSRKETEDPDRVDLDVKVKEQSTGEFNVGAGYSTFDGLLATTDVRERNFLGKGQEVNVRFAISQRQQNFNVGLTEPYFLGQDFSAGVDAFNEKTDYQDESSYDLASTGADLRFGFPLSEFSRNTVKFGYKDTKVDNVGSAASQFVKREEGDLSTLFLSDTISFDNRDSTLTPTRGYRLAATGEYAGFGLDNSYARGTVSGSWHKELADDWILSLGARGGAVESLGDRLPLFEHFQGGGNQLRGFKFGGIGPRDSLTDDSLGGKYMLGNSAEVSFPLTGALKELGVNGLFFLDGGTVWDFDGANSSVEDSKDYRLAAGTGVFWRSPIGPLRLEFGMPLVKSAGDKTQIFSFSVGSRF